MKLIEAFYQQLRHPFSISIDSRSVDKDDVFIAMAGAKTHGNSYIPMALEKGAQIAVAEDTAVELELPVWKVPNTLSFLQRLAVYHRNRYMGIPAIGITGSNGKTTTKNLLHAVLSQRFKLLCTEGNYNNHIGLPLTVSKLESAHDMAIFEMGASKIGDIAQLCQIAKPTLGILTNIGRAHLETFGGIEGVKKGKYELADWLRRNSGTLFIHEKEDSLNDLVHEPYVKTVGHIFREHKVQMQISSKDTGLECRLFHQGIEEIFQSSLFGEYNGRNLEMAVAVGLEQGCDINQISQGISSFASDDLRSQVVKLGSKLIIADMYNANPDSMAKSIGAFLENANVQEPAIVLGDMLELGSYSARSHMHVIKMLESVEQLKFILTVGENFAQVLKEMVTKKTFSVTNDDAVKFLIQEQNRWSSLLIKGSRSMHLENVLVGLKEVDHL